MDQVIRDPEGSETALLNRLVNFDGKRVLEVGCGDGRLTWRYAYRTATVTAIDPSEEAITAAIQDRPAELVGRVTFLQSELDAYAQAYPSATFDRAILAWSL